MTESVKLKKIRRLFQTLISFLLNYTIMQVVAFYYLRFGEPDKIILKHDADILFSQKM